MRNLLKKWNMFFNNREFGGASKKIHAKVRLTAIITTLLLFVAPAAILVSNVLSIYSGIFVWVHIMLWSLPFYGNFAIMMYSKFTYDLYYNYLPDIEIFEKVSSKEVMLGGLLNPFTFFAICVCVFIIELIL